MFTETEIQAKANEVLVMAGMVDEAPISVEKIAKLLGFECRYFIPDNRTADISGAVDHKAKKIYINRSESPQRMNFTLAHEIGHIVLHNGEHNFIDYRRPSADPKEKEADSFAGNLLMPESIFRREWERLRKDYSLLSQFFQVSRPAIGMRAYCLGLE